MYKNIIIFILIIVLILINNYDLSTFINLSDFKYFNENNDVIDHHAVETDEQLMALDYIEPHDIILELGARYGTVSVLMAKVVGDKGKLVAVEIDKNVFNVLEDNRKRNNVNFEICNNIISNKPVSINYEGYGTHQKDTDINNDSPLRISYDEFKKKYPYKFNVLVADCEGCLEYFLEMIGDDLQNYNKILFEADRSDSCDYNKIIKKLKDNGFVLKNERFNEVSRYYFKRE
jgi:FkbM family methyltransferase